MWRERQKRGISNLKIAIVVAQDRNGNRIARKAGRGRVKAEEIDIVIGEYVHPSSLLWKQLVKKEMLRCA